VEPGVGVTLYDAFRRNMIFMADVGMGNSMSEGFGLAGRVIPLDGFYMSGGAMLPMDAKAGARLERHMDGWFSGGMSIARLTPPQEADVAAQIIRTCLESGMGEHIMYASPGQDRRPGRGSPEPTDRVRANRNDPCPCGSGRKYKSCCGKR
jgi:hypothetical protein